ncbi:uncharacterized protein ARMOST_01267 [Armillaria ostoyae]|uniref:Uncharacterized protein n=1 Tax=Armillaria ostoyae TaxID=47428 RepID=A0A284QNH0_ARMOS|nr:uncharacterized protein ARMOST_01267 [Armillaria ostoyae]
MMELSSSLTFLIILEELYHFGDPLGDFDSVALYIRVADGIWPFGALIIIFIEGHEERQFCDDSRWGTETNMNSRLFVIL